MVKYVDGETFSVSVSGKGVLSINIPNRHKGTEHVELWIARCIKIKEHAVFSKINKTVKGCTVDPSGKIDVCSESKGANGTTRTVHFSR